MAEVIVVSCQREGTLIEDIQVRVPFQVATPVPDVLMRESKDLWLRVQDRSLFLLKGGKPPSWCGQRKSAWERIREND